MRDERAVFERLLKHDIDCLRALNPGWEPVQGAGAARGQLLLVSETPTRQVPLRGLIGFDEAGRGALAGPVAVGCISFNVADLATSEMEEALIGLNDSKQVTPRNRARLYELICTHAHVAVGYASAREIDESGIVDACQRAMARAFAHLRGRRTHDLGLCDRGLALDLPDADTPLAQRQITKGDATSLHIAAASILAKVSRDRLMVHLDDRFPQYGFATHKGYGTARHYDAIAERGPSPVHRMSFLKHSTFS